MCGAGFPTTPHRCTETIYHPRLISEEETSSHSFAVAPVQLTVVEELEDRRCIKLDEL